MNRVCSTILAVQELRLLPLEIRAVARDVIELPAFSGSTLRGSLGHALLDTVCVTSHRECGDCRVSDVCSYPYLFETAPPPGSRRLSGLPFAPHPYVLVPPEGAGNVGAGEEFRFGLTLIGRATELLPTVAGAILRMSERGLGRTRGQFDVSSIAALPPAPPEPLVQGDPPALVRSYQQAICTVAAYLPDPGLERLELSFVSPLRLVRKGRLEEEIPFHLLIRALLRRASSLLEFHEGIDLDLDFKRLIEEAGQVELTSSDLRRTDQVRFSARQQRTMNLVGVQGSVVYSGRLERFLPLLALGLAVGAGKGTTFGLGRMRIPS